MGLFDFWGAASSPVTVPTFQQGANRDSTDLQIRSLLYLFKRLRINRLASFVNGSSLKYTDGKLWDEVLSGTDLNISKLDAMYNLSGFEKLLLLDEQRVLIDFPKNKFRMLCVLSELPSPNFSRPLSPVKGATTSDEMEGGFPIIKDYKDRYVQNFHFLLLPLDTKYTSPQLAAELANSSIYVEHFSYVTFPARVHTANKAIRAVLGETAGEDSSIVLSEDTKATLLAKYLAELAFLVQLIRIYDQHIKQLDSLPVKPLSPVKLKSMPSIPHLQSSPSRVLQPTSPNLRRLSRPKSLANLRAPQLASRPSILNFNANEIYNPVASPPSPEKNRPSISTLGGYSASDLSHHSLYGREVRPELWEKCKSSIREKLSRESKLLQEQVFLN